MALDEYVRALRSRWLVVALVTVVAVAVTALGTLLTTPTYSASTRLFFSVRGGETLAELNQGSSFAQGQLSSYAEVATSPYVLEPVAAELGLELSSQELASKISVDIPANTAVLELTATTTDANLSAAIANAVSDRLASAASSLSPERNDGEETVRVTVLSSASAPEAPSAPNVVLNLGLGLLGGFLLGTAAATVREHSDTKIRNDADIAAVLSLPIIGRISYDKTASVSPVFIQEEPLGAAAEAIRRLRTNLQFLQLSDAGNVLVVTSSVPGEGKSTTAINLAVALADSGAAVILVDADLRRPSVASYMGMEGRVGLTTVLIGRAEVSEVAQRWRDTHLDVLTSGQVPPNPSELLGSRAMQSLLRRLESEYEYVIVDTPPLLPVTDAAVLSKFAGGTLVVAGADRIHKGELLDSIESLTAVDATVVGIVLNKLERSGRPSSYYDAYGDQGSASPPVRGSGGPGATWPGRPLAAWQSDEVSLNAAPRPSTRRGQAQDGGGPSQ